MPSFLRCVMLRTILTRLDKHCSCLPPVAFACLYTIPTASSRCSLLPHLYKFSNVPLHSSQMRTQRLLSSTEFGPTEVINFEQLSVMLKNKTATLVDVREPAELECDGKIPGSINISLAKVEEAFQMSSENFQECYGIPLPKKDDPTLVFTCKSGRRATAAILKLSALGYKAKCYSGSFLDWVEKGGQIQKA